MKRQILAVLLVLTAISGYAQTKKTPPENYDPSRVVVFSFVSGYEVFMLNFRSNEQKLKEAISFMDENRMFIEDGSMPIFVFGHCGLGGNEEARKERVKRMSNYVKGELIRLKKAKENYFVTSNSTDRYSDTLANAVVLKFYLPYDYEARKPKSKKKSQPAVEIPIIEHRKQEPVVTPGIDSPQAEVTEQPSAQEAEANERVEQAVVAPTVAEQAAPVKVKSTDSHLRWYAGIELGLPVGISTFTAFEPKGGAGFEGGVLGGYRFSPLLSAEFGATFGTMKLGASKCCSDYWLGADGVRYLAQVAGMESYSYKDVYSSVFVQQYALRMNVDMLQICNPDWQKRWSLTVSPAIYGIGTKATLKTDNTTLCKRDGRFQFGAGVGIGGGYQVTENLGVGLRTGMVWVFGEPFDGITPSSHSENMIWNNTLTLTWRFGCNK